MPRRAGLRFTAAAAQLCALNSPRAAQMGRELPFVYVHRWSWYINNMNAQRIHAWVGRFDQGSSARAGCGVAQRRNGAMYIPMRPGLEVASSASQRWLPARRLCLRAPSFGLVAVEGRLAGEHREDADAAHQLSGPSHAPRLRATWHHVPPVHLSGCGEGDGGSRGGAVSHVPRCLSPTSDASYMLQLQQSQEIQHRLTHAATTNIWL